jgi:hypothetical protein
MSQDSFKIKKSLNIKPSASPTLNEQGDIAYDTADDKLKVRGSSATDPVVQEAKSQTLTNKTIDADSNTISNIDNADIKSGAAIDRAKIASGSANQVLINDGSGALSSEAQLAPSRGGTGVSNAATLTYGTDNLTLTTAGVTNVTLPTTGTLATLAGAEALSNKTQIDVDNLRLDGNTLSSTDTNGDITLNPNGSGEINLEATVRTNAIDTPGAGTLTVGGTDATTITIGNSGTTVNFNGTVNNNNVTNLNVTDKLITINDGGGAASGSDSGLEIEENGSITGYMKTSGDRNSVIFKAPNTNGITSLTPGASNDVVTLNAATQTLSNKTLSDSLTLAEVATPSTPSSGFGRVYFKSDGFLYQQNDAGTETKVGAGAGGINYITNSDFESNADGYSAYADAAGTAPVDATGGTPNVTITRTTSTPLRGTASGLITKDAANRQGQGISVDLDVSLADAAKVLTVEFDYTIASGTYATGDLTVYLIEDRGGTPTVIQPAGYQIQSATVGLPQKHIATFQTSSDSAKLDYRLAFHVASTSASAYTVKFDNVRVGPQVVQYGAPLTSPVEYTPTLTGFTSVTGLYATWARVGKYVQIQGRFLENGTPSGTTAAISLPAGLVASSSISSILAVGDWWPSGGNVAYPVLIQANDTAFGIGINANFLSKRPANAILGTANSVSFNALIPIQGWESTVQMSNDTDTRVVGAYYNGSATGTVNSSYNTVTFPTRVLDTHNAYSGGVYTVPVPGNYDISAFVNVQGSFALNQYVAVAVFVDGTIRQEFYSYSGAYINLGGAVSVKALPLNAGQLVTIRVLSNATTPSYTAGASLHNFSIARVSGPSAIAASESITARYTTAAGQSIPNSSTTVIDFGTKEYDSHTAVTTGGSWRFIAPIAAVYSVNARVAITGTTAAGEGVLLIRKNGSEYAQSNRGPLTTSGPQGFLASTDVRLLAGEYIDIALFQSNGASRSLETLAAANTVSICKVGNY